MADFSPDRYGPSLHQVIHEPLDSLRLLGKRAWLALIGIAVGCAAVVALLNIGHNAANEALRVFNGLGTDLLVANMNEKMEGGPQPATATMNVSGMLHNLPELSAGAPLILTSLEARRHGAPFSAVVIGSTADLASILNLSVRQGRPLNRYDPPNTYAVLGAKTAMALGKPGSPVMPGDTIQLGGYLFDVVGILSEQEPPPLIPVLFNESILLPIESMRRLIEAPEINMVIVRTRQRDHLDSTAAALHDYLAPRFPGRDINVQIPRLLVEGMTRQSQMFSLLLAGLGGISLLVGGVGVMNVMVMNIAERRREIGVRMALGARPVDIGCLFLLEAIVLTVAGAISGALTGVAAAWVVGKLSGWDFTLSVASIPLGIGSSLIIGVFFGLHPAMTAARLEPVRALRDD
ncbi:ABC transporter permease [Musicola keenii]|uniref:ABC transporter permease n=1 Tax=Musicola keenii TaxID=2884250 RepID=UPI001785BBE6|nr:ABC transporter permease [Musicola keenii]